MRLLCARQLELFSAISEGTHVAEEKPEVKPAAPAADGGWDTVRSIEDSVAKLADEPELGVLPDVVRGGIADSTDEPTRFFDF